MPITRRQVKSGSIPPDEAFAQPSDTKAESLDLTKELLFSIIDDVSDDALLHGRDAKALRDATTSAIEQVWNDTCATTALLTSKINESNASLQDKLEESFAAVGKRLDNMPTIAIFHSDAPTPRVTSFSGVSENGMQFSIWLRRLEDVMRMRPAPFGRAARKFPHRESGRRCSGKSRGAR
uniref:Uncharacterized protein n=1 Tax=Haemonchus contortus TaxID=6289 RepID=W6NGJ6_HAECO